MLKKRKRVLSILIIVFSLMLTGINVFILLKQKLVRVYVSSHLINQRSLIKEEDLKEIFLPSAFINEDIIIDKEEIVGKVTRLGYGIAKGSFFYYSFLESSETISDKAQLALLEEEAAYDLYLSDIKANPANLKTGLRVDLYLTIEEEKPLSDLFLQGVRVIGCYDRSGKMVEGGEISIITLAVNEKDISIINKALLLGKISISIGSNRYDSESKSRLVTDSSVYAYLK